MYWLILSKNLEVWMHFMYSKTDSTRVNTTVQLFVNMDQVMMFNTQVPMCRIRTLWEFAHNALSIDSLWSPWVCSEAEKVVTNRSLWNIHKISSASLEHSRPMSVFKPHDSLWNIHERVWNPWEPLEWMHLNRSLHFWSLLSLNINEKLPS